MVGVIYSNHYFEVTIEGSFIVLFVTFMRRKLNAGSSCSASGQHPESDPSFVSCTFLWVRRLCNIPANTAAKLALSTDISFCFSSNNLPPPLRLACMADCPLVS